MGLIFYHIRWKPANPSNSSVSVSLELVLQIWMGCVACYIGAGIWALVFMIVQWRLLISESFQQLLIPTPWEKNSLGNGRTSSKEERPKLEWLRSKGNIGRNVIIKNEGDSYKSFEHNSCHGRLHFRSVICKSLTLLLCPICKRRQNSQTPKYLAKHDQILVLFYNLALSLKVSSFNGWIGITRVWGMWARGGSLRNMAGMKWKKSTIKNSV